jgi:hypothetical protein
MMMMIRVRVDEQVCRVALNAKKARKGDISESSEDKRVRSKGEDKLLRQIGLRQKSDDIHRLASLTNPLSECQATASFFSLTEKVTGWEQQ